MDRSDSVARFTRMEDGTKQEYAIIERAQQPFVRGLADSVAGLPPPQAKKKEGVLEQARRALSPGRGKQPRAQPQEGNK